MYDIFSEFEDFFNSFEVFPQYREERTCPVCKQSYHNFQKSGKFGCASCYETFRNPIMLTLKQIHQNSTHTGKIPSQSAGEIKIRKQYEDLKTALQMAVSEENYEEAARIHKELKSLGNIDK